MKKLLMLLASSGLFFASFVYAEHTFIPTPRSSYMAQRPELPSPKTITYNFEEGFYVAGHLSASRVGKSGKLEGVSHPAVRKNKDNVFGGRVAMGVMLKETGFLNRVEAEYAYQGKIRHKGATAGTHYSVSNQTGLIKAYSSMNLGHQIFPYVFAGAGISSSRVKVSTLLNGDVVTGSSKRSKLNFAAAGGAGVRFRLNDQLMADVNYEFDYFGKTRKFPLYKTGSSLSAGQMNLSDFNVHTLNVGFILQPFNPEIER